MAGCTGMSTDYSLHINVATVACTVVVERVNSFRGLTSTQQQSLLDYERHQFGRASKKYSNWCDMDLHTFSLMTSGISFVRVRNQLTLTQPMAARRPYIVVGQPASPEQIGVRQPSPILGLSTPPAPPIQANTGFDAELLVSNLLRRDGFEVIDYTRVRGYGFD